MALLMRPGFTLLLAGAAAYVVSNFIGSLPLIGGTVAVMLFLFSIFAVVGGLWLVVAEFRNPNR
jgi:membrane protein implicated in regulation of membrane protease activity